MVVKLGHASSILQQSLELEGEKNEHFAEISYSNFLFAFALTRSHLHQHSVISGSGG